jgi:hypothetical protein
MKGCDEGKKVGWGGAREIFSKVESTFTKILNMRGCIYKIFKSAGVQNFIFPSYDPFF